MGNSNKKITLDEIYVSRVRFIHMEKEPGVWVRKSIERPLPETGDPLMDAVARLLAKRDFVTPEEVRDLLQMNQETCNSYFVFRTGKSVSDLLLDYRMKIASELLRFSKLKQKEIAQRLGYSYSTNMSCVFKRRYGLAPSDYRMKYRAKLPMLNYL